jgi:hypothetical protein
VKNAGGMVVANKINKKKMESTLTIIIEKTPFRQLFLTTRSTQLKGRTLPLQGKTAKSDALY